MIDRLEVLERVAFLDGSGVVELGSPFTWAVKEEEHAHGVTIACTTKEFYTASGIARSSWSLMLGSPFTWTVKEEERAHGVTIAWRFTFRCGTRAFGGP